MPIYVADLRPFNLSKGDAISAHAIDDAEARKTLFLDCFRKSWLSRLAAEPDVLSKYSGSGWTRVMLGGPGEPEGVLQSASQSYAEQLGEACSVQTQWYTLDLSLVAPPCRGATEYWQTRTVLSVEHENGDDVETEMWKLAHWRSPLSVCVFYDFNEGKLDEKIYRGDHSVGDVQRRAWLTQKLQLLSHIAGGIDDDVARHLLIIGNRMLDGSLRWRWSDWRKIEFGPAILF